MNTIQNISGYLTAYAHEVITVSSTPALLSPTKLVPNATQLDRDQRGARLILLSVVGANVRYWVDGGVPDASTGHLLVNGSMITLAGDQALKQLTMIRTASTDADVAITYFR